MDPDDAPAIASPALERWLPLAVAIVTALAVVVAIGPWPVGVYQDDGIYTILAKSLATGHGYRYLNLPGEPFATHYPPVYPAFLALLWKVWPVFPQNAMLFKGANAVLAALAAYGAWRFARARCGLGLLASTAASLVFTACVPVVFLSAMVLSEPLFLAVLFPVLWLGERAAGSGRIEHAVGAGAAGAGLSLIRTLGIVVVPATMAVLLWRRRWRAAAVTGAVAVVVMLPWQIWIGRHSHDVAGVFDGKYGPYLSWLTAAVRREGPLWEGKVAAANMVHVTEQGWEVTSIRSLPLVLRWTATAFLTLLFAAGCFELVRRAPVAAWALLGYLALVVAWPFLPARFIWGVWPLIGIPFALGVASLATRGARRRPVVVRAGAGVAVLLLACGYVGYNWVAVTSGWWAHVQQATADRARPLAQWAIADSRPGDVLATDDDVLIYLYTGRHALPNGVFTPEEHLVPQTPAFAAHALHEILASYKVNYVLASTEFGVYAARGLLQASPPELRIVRGLSSGAVFEPVHPVPNE